MFALLKAVFISAGTVVGATLGYAIVEADPDYWSSVLGEYVGADPDRALSAVFGFAGYLISSLIARETGNIFVKWLEKANTRRISSGLAGVLAGLLFSSLSMWTIFLNIGDVEIISFDSFDLMGAVVPVLRFFVPLLINLTFASLGWAIATRQWDNQDRVCHEESTTLLDSSVLIDGRIDKLAETGFLPGNPVVPKYVLLELQHLADYGDKTRREKALKGLASAAYLKEKYNLILNDDSNAPSGVDIALIETAKKSNAVILTNDRGLSSLAEVEGIKTLNIQDLAMAMHTPVDRGDSLILTPIQSGRDKGQGVGYLGDGTMVVVEGGEHLIGKEIEVHASKTINTSAGRLIFAVPVDSLNEDSGGKAKEKNEE